MLKRDIASFEVGEYLQARAQNPDFLAVEYGHREKPIAFSDGANFTGGRAYVGVEANLRNPFACLQNIIADSGKKGNHFFIDHDVGGRRSWRGLDDCDIEGDYNTETILPPGVADEVFAANVVTDPIVAQYEDRTKGFVAELARVVAPAGRVILRETITPSQGFYLQEALALSGLSKVGKVRPKDKEWVELEKVYNCEYDPLYPCISKNSYYLFLQKDR